MANNLSEYVKSKCAKAESMELGAYFCSNAFPLVVEPKYDGRRVFLFKSGDSIVLATKHNGIYTEKQYPELFKAISAIDLSSSDKLILDCEFMPQDQKLVIFDVLNVNGQDMTAKTLRERKDILASLKIENARVSTIPAIETNNTVQVNSAFEMYVEKLGHEGIVIKNPESRYGQAGSWLKWKKQETLDVVVTGRDDSKEGDSFFIATYQDGQLVDMGKVGSFRLGVDREKIKPGTILEVQYQEMTADKHLRHPFAVRIREDKIAEECLINVKGAIAN